MSYRSSKKNGKTSTRVALALYHLFTDIEIGGEVCSAALLKIYHIIQKLEECTS